MSQHVSPHPPSTRPAGAATAAAPGILFGIGLGGFVDGILLHQILQWHHMVSSVEGYPVDTVAGLEVNTLADGFFHVFAWCAVLGAAVLTLSQWRERTVARLGVDGYQRFLDDHEDEVMATLADALGGSLTT